MDTNGEINRPGEDVEIDFKFDGSIRCRNLMILKDGSVCGAAVVEERIRVLGEFAGVADCQVFEALPPARAVGTLFAPDHHVKGRNGHDVDFRMFVLSNRQAIFALPSTVVPDNFEAAINRGIIEAITKSVPSRTPDYVDPRPMAGSQGAEPLSDVDLSEAASTDELIESFLTEDVVASQNSSPAEAASSGLIERLASKGLSPLNSAEPEGPADPEFASSSGRTALPLLV